MGQRRGATHGRVWLYQQAHGHTVLRLPEPERSAALNRIGPENRRDGDRRSADASRAAARAALPGGDP